MGFKNPTGVFFFEQSAEAIAGAVAEFEANASGFDPVACRENAMRFSTPRFVEEFRSFVENAWRSICAK